ncbi:MAG: hypothetical protein LBP36_04425 [Oscillospiraceae bacterium]|nr:hypothetical protein [Oscillospiraceae bacterium]
MNLEDALKNYGTRIEHSVAVKIGGSAFDPDGWILSSFEAELSIDLKANSCSVFYVQNVQFSSKFDFSVSVKLGSKFELSAGYVVDGKPENKVIFTGFIYSYQFEVLGSSEYSKLTINSMDVKVWMMPGLKTKQFKGKETPSAVAKDILSPYSKYASYDVAIKNETQIKIPLVQYQKSDYEYMCDLAKTCGCLFYCDENGKVYFVDMSQNKSIAFTIESFFGIYSIKFDANIWGVPKSSQIVALNEKDYSDPLTVSVSPTSLIGSGSLASELSSAVSATYSSVLNSPKDSGEARFLAGAALQQVSLFSKLTVVSPLIPGYGPGVGVKVEGLGYPLDNVFLIESVNYSFDSVEKNFKTTFLLATDVLPSSSGFYVPDMPSFDIPNIPFPF